MRECPVVLVSMPFGNILSPSMGLSLLKGLLNRAGIDGRVLYFTLRFARLTGTGFYLKVANDLNPTVRELAGEWIFARALFGDRAADARSYVDGVLRNGHVDRYVAPLLAAVRGWVAAHESSALFAADTGAHLVLVDVRPAAPTLVTVLAGVDRELYRACDGICDVRHLRDRASACGDDPVEALGRLDGLVARGLMMKSGTRYLALAIPLGEYSPPPAIVRRVIRLAKRAGEPDPGGVRLPLTRRGGGSPLVLDSSCAKAGLRVPAGVRPPRRLVPQHFSSR